MFLTRRKEDTMNNWLKLSPTFHEMLWGGSKIREVFNYETPSNRTGEAWVISAHPQGACLISEGDFASIDLATAYKNNREYFGVGKNTKFPIMIKIIDAHKDLSIQVHPDDTYALAHEDSLGKYESWYILDAGPTTRLEIGHNAKDVDEFKEMLLAKQYDELFRYIPIKVGDCFNVAPGTVHAICSGTLVYEVQQNSNVTYRIYDYDRTDTKGNLRELHIDKSMEVVVAPSTPTNDNVFNETGSAIKKLIDNKYFSLFEVNVEEEVTIPLEDTFITLTVIEGETTINDISAGKGDNYIFLPKTKQVVLSGKAKILMAKPKLASME
jgi:mannose-6-phosphate isomerase